MTQAADPAPQPVPLGELPEPIRQRILGWAATAVGELPTGEIPVALRGVARFAPAKRARLGAGVLARQLENDHGFRALTGQVAERAPIPARDAVGAAARAVLLRLPDSAEL